MKKFVKHFSLIFVGLSLFVGNGHCNNKLIKDAIEKTSFMTAEEGKNEFDFVSQKQQDRLANVLQGLSFEKRIRKLIGDVVAEKYKIDVRDRHYIEDNEDKFIVNILASIINDSFQAYGNESFDGMFDSCGQQLSSFDYAEGFFLQNCSCFFGNENSAKKNISGEIDSLVRKMYEDVIKSAIEKFSVTVGLSTKQSDKIKKVFFDCGFANTSRLGNFEIISDWSPVKENDYVKVYRASDETNVRMVEHVSHVSMEKLKALITGELAKHFLYEDRHGEFKLADFNSGLFSFRNSFIRQYLYACKEHYKKTNNDLNFMLVSKK